MTTFTRRRFLASSAATAAGLAVAGPFSGYVARAAKPTPPSGGVGYGPLAGVVDLRDNTTVRLELPAGFQYRTFHPAGTVLGDGVTLPGRHDGMAAFALANGNSLLIRNHEINGPGAPLGGEGAVYDPMTRGGTVNVEVDWQGNVVRDWVSLQGSQMNCAGGRTPWGTWITCEETVNGGDVGPDFTGAPNTGLLPHGYLFEVPMEGTSDAVPIRAAGRFAHEAAAISHDWRHVYLTEDNFNFPSGFYRYKPPRSPKAAGSLEDGGRLEMLAVKGIPNADLSVGQAPGTTYNVGWVTIDDPDPTFAAGTTNDQAISAVGDQGRAKGAAIFSRLEGCYTAANGEVFFTSTQGGAMVGTDPDGFGAGRGQVWAYDSYGQRLRLVYESPAIDTLDLPDNVVVSPGGALVLCEDGSGDNFLRGLTQDGQIFNFARNADPAQVGQEFAGATFSADGRTLFVNVQSSTGYSVAIWGPWEGGGF
jgi:secreted PhoX family phosphatase